SQNKKRLPAGGDQRWRKPTACATKTTQKLLTPGSPIAKRRARARAAEKRHFAALFAASRLCRRRRDYVYGNRLFAGEHHSLLQAVQVLDACACVEQDDALAAVHGAALDQLL